jgi:hypothetical protein
LAPTRAANRDRWFDLAETQFGRCCRGAAGRKGANIQTVKIEDSRSGAVHRFQDRSRFFLGAAAAGLNLAGGACYAQQPVSLGDADRRAMALPLAMSYSLGNSMRSPTSRRPVAQDGATERTVPDLAMSANSKTPRADWRPGRHPWQPMRRVRRPPGCCSWLPMRWPINPHCASPARAKVDGERVEQARGALRFSAAG